MITRVVFPSFGDEEYAPYEMRQLVSALELRFQSIESDQDSSTTQADLELKFSQIGHSHTESEISDLKVYLENVTSESIFDLSIYSSMR